MADQNDTPQNAEKNGDTVQPPQENMALTKVAEVSELVQVNDCLLALRNTTAIEHHKLMRRLKSAETKIQKRDAELQSVKNELAKSNAEWAITKADLLGNLLSAERKIKKLQQERSDAKNYFMHHYLPLSENLNNAIRSRYGDVSASNMATPIVSATDDVRISTDDISASSTMLPIAPNVLESTVLPVAEPAVLAEQPLEKNVPADDDGVIVENQQTETGDVAIQFECDQCPKLFKTMAHKYRHEQKSHNGSSGTNRKEIKLSKRLKRVRPNVLAKKAAFKNRMSAQKSLAASFAKVGMFAPVFKQLVQELHKHNVSQNKI